TASIHSLTPNPFSFLHPTWQSTTYFRPIRWKRCRRSASGLTTPTKRKSIYEKLESVDCCRSCSRFWIGNHAGGACKWRHCGCDGSQSTRRTEKSTESSQSSCRSSRCDE